MPIILPKYQTRQRDILRDVRPPSQRVKEYMGKPHMVATVSACFAVMLFGASPNVRAFADILFVPIFFYLRWGMKRPFSLPFKMPRYANMPDPHNPPPGKTSGGKADGILYIGNVTDKDDEEFQKEVWLTNNDARTHILYIGTTGSGKTEGLKSMVTNALCWGSGFSYTDGKADTDLWASLYSLTRRFGRDDDILILNYMTGNSDDGSLSNSMNPFSNGSASYLANLVVNLMPDAGGDNAMWKERAVALMFALMPALTYKRDKQGLLLDVGVVRDHLELQPIIRLSRDHSMPDRIIHGLEGYLNTLPGYVAAAFDDDGNERPPSPDQPMYDLQVARQQHGYLSMQFTRAMQSLADEYGYIFKAQLADIDVLDLVLNRRILVVLIPALEKSGEEAANLGKIVASCLKGMMGATLGNTVEGGWENAIGSKQTRASSSFMTVFDEVGYYTAAGMAVMAAQARSLGFSLVFAAQDLPSMEKRVKQEARSILGNCNFKIFGRIEDPTDTKTFVEGHGGQSWVMEANSFSAPLNTVGSLFMSLPYYDNRSVNYNIRYRVCYDHLRGQREGEAHVFLGDWAHKITLFYAQPERAKALRVHRFLPVPGVTKSTEARERILLELETRLKDPDWTAEEAGTGRMKESLEIDALAQTIKGATATNMSALEMAAACVASMAALAEAPASSDEESDGDSNEGDRKRPELVGRIESYAGAAESSKYTVSSYADDLSDEEWESQRHMVPPLLEGDQYGIQDVERGSYTSGKGAPAFAGTDADLAAIIPEIDDEDIPKFEDTDLSERTKALIAQSAQKMNEGLLSGKSDQAS